MEHDGKGCTQGSSPLDTPPMPPSKKPSQNPSPKPSPNPTRETPTAADQAYLGHIDIMQRLDQGDAADIVVGVFRDAPQPVLLHEYLGCDFTIDVLRMKHGAGRYQIVLTEKGSRAYILRRTFNVGGAIIEPKADAAATPTPAPATDMNAVQMLMLKSSEERNAALLQAIITRPQTDPLALVTAIVPLIAQKSDSSADPVAIVRLARDLGKDLAPRNEAPEEGEGSSFAKYVGPALQSVVSAFARPLPPPPQPHYMPPPAPRPQHVAAVPPPAPAPSTPTPPTATAPTPTSAPTPAPIEPPGPAAPPGSHELGAQPGPHMADEEVSAWPAGLTYTDDQDLVIQEMEGKAESMGMHAVVGDMAAVLKLGASQPPDVTAREVLWWFKFSEEVAESPDELVQIRDTLAGVLESCALAAAGQPAPNFIPFATFSGVDERCIIDVAAQIHRLVEESKQPPHPAPLKLAQ